MFERRLKALDYMDWNKVNGNDVQHFRKLVAWLEDQKIRHYTIQDRDELRKIDSEKWERAFDKYLDDLACPVTTGPLDKLEWLLGLAVHLEFEDDVKKYQETQNKQNDQPALVPSVKSTNPFDNLNYDSDEFKAGVKSIAKLLKVSCHPNHLITLEACCNLVSRRLNRTALANPGTVVVTGKPFPIMDTDLGFNMGSDRVLNNAAKALSLLYIQDLRNLQTRINEAIVSVQSITANPKTDTKLGKVGI